jgi:hypothetical protein
LRTLGLEHGASRNEIRDAYRDLVKVWHPDRFPNDLKLRKKAEEKLKEVNAAFEHLKSSVDTPPARAASATKKPEDKPETQKHQETYDASKRTSQSASASAKETTRPNASAQEPPRQDASAPNFSNAARPQSYSNARPQPPTPEPYRPINKGAPSAFFSFRRIPHWVVLAFSVAFTRMCIDSCTKPKPSENQIEMMNSYTEARNKAFNQLYSVPNIKVTPLTSPSSPKQNEKRSRNTIPSLLHSSEDRGENSQQVPKSHLEQNNARDAYFSRGSTIDEVLALQGTPTSTIGNRYYWGYSTVDFSNARVIAWDNSELGRPLKVKMLSKGVAPTSGYFTMGSTIDEVLALQGTPTSTIGNRYYWGFSTVDFSNGRVIAWDNSELGRHLKVKLLSNGVAPASGYFTMGSSVDEVLALQGTPSSTIGNRYYWGFSTVDFSNGQVIAWDNSKLGRHLKVKLQ